MNQMITGDMMLVPLRQKTFEALLSLRKTSNESFDEVVSRLAGLQMNANQMVAASGMSNAHLGDDERYAFSLLGERHAAHTARDLLVAVLRVLHELDANLLSELSLYRARKRRYVAGSPDRLYPGRPDLARYSAKVADGWWVGTNHSRRDVVRILRAACSVCGLEYGKDLVVEFKTPYL